MTDVLSRLALASLFMMATIGTGACDSEFSLAGFTADEAFADPEVERLARAAVSGDLPEMEAAVAAGADVDYQGEQKMTPLAWAMFAEGKAGFEKLVQLGADPFLQDEKTRTVAAITTGVDDPDYLEILLKNGMDPNQPEGHQGLPVIFEAIAHSRWPQFELLLEYCTDLHWVREPGSAKSIGSKAALPEHYDMLLRLLEEGYAFDLTGLASSILRPDIDKEAFPEAAAKRERILDILRDRGVSFPVDLNVRIPPPAERLAPLYAKSCQELPRAPEGVGRRQRHPLVKWARERPPPGIGFIAPSMSEKFWQKAPDFT
ncbi:MAG: hypothetical protein ACR2RA_23015 [Geminicoccaceae bacterium]